MTKKILATLALVLALTSCKQGKEEVKEPIKKVAIEAGKEAKENQDKKDKKLKRIIFPV